MKVKDYLKINEKKEDYKYYFVVKLISKHRNEERKISKEYNYKTKKREIEKYLNCKIDKIENFDIPFSNWNFNGETSNGIMKNAGDKIYINLADFLNINKAWAKLIEKENKQKRFTL